MIKRNVGDFSVSAEQEGGLSVDVEDGQLLAAFENVEPPLGLRLPGLGRLAVLHHHPVESVRVGQQIARESEIHAFGRVGCSVRRRLLRRRRRNVVRRGRCRCGLHPGLARLRLVLPPLASHRPARGTGDAVRARPTGAAAAVRRAEVKMGSLSLAPLH